jgi:hypothetical protein
VALSTTEEEYMAATHASKEAVWLQRLYLSHFFRPRAQVTAQNSMTPSEMKDNNGNNDTNAIT